MDPAHPAVERLLTVGALVNDAAIEREGERIIGHGDPTETALLVAALKAGIDPKALAPQWPRHHEIPFDPTARFMATFHETPSGGRALLVKGAPGEIVRRSVRQQDGNGARPLDEDGRAQLLEANRGWRRKASACLRWRGGPTGGVTGIRWTA